MAKYQGILFDVDGTLIHSSPGIFDTMLFTFSKMGKDMTGIDLTQYVGPPLRRTFGEHFSNPEDVEKAVEIYRNRYRTHGQFGCTLFPDVTKMLNELKNNGIRLYTATSKPKEAAIPLLERLGIAQMFDYIGAASTDASIDTKTAVISSVLQQTPLLKDALLMVGDRKEDFIGAKDCGLDAVGVLYGYGLKQELEQFNPIYLASTCDDFLQWFLR